MQLGKSWHIVGLLALIGAIAYFAILPYVQYGLNAAHLNEIDPFRIQHGADVDVPREEIVRGAVKDQIPAITEPKFVSAEVASAWLSNDARVLGVVHNSVAKAYPVLILLWHEAVNDRVGGKPYLVTY